MITEGTGHTLAPAVFHKEFESRPASTSAGKGVPLSDRRLRSRRPETSAQDYKDAAYFSIHFLRNFPITSPGSDFAIASFSLRK